MLVLRAYILLPQENRLVHIDFGKYKDKGGYTCMYRNEHMHVCTCAKAHVYMCFQGRKRIHTRQQTDHSGFICVEGGSVGFGGKVHLLTSVGQASFLAKLAY